MDVVNRVSQQPSKKRRKPRFSLDRSSLPIALAALIILVGGWFAVGWLAQGKNRAIDRNLNQAVFMTNGQVYFGKLHSLKGEYLDLREIYYLQLQDTDEQQSDNRAADAMTNLDASSDVKLIKLGNELHGPTDKMLINKDQVLFWENMKQDSKVSQAIRQHQQE